MNTSWLGVQKSQRWFSWEERLASHQKAAHDGGEDPGCQACVDLREKVGTTTGDGRNRPGVA